MSTEIVYKGKKYTRMEVSADQILIGDITTFVPTRWVHGAYEPTGPRQWFVVTKIESSTWKNSDAIMLVVKKKGISGNKGTTNNYHVTNMVNVYRLIGE
jgi:hypothetical protein